MMNVSRAGHNEEPARSAVDKKFLVDSAENISKAKMQIAARQ
jgi:hypothetical protein